MDSKQLDVLLAFFNSFQVLGNVRVTNAKLRVGNPCAHVRMDLGVDVRIDAKHGSGSFARGFSCEDDVFEVKF